MIISFARPYALFGLLLIPLIIFFYFYSLKKKKLYAMKFSQLGFIKSALSNKKKLLLRDLPIYLTVLATALLIVGLSEPHIPLKHAKQGVNVVLVLDVSGSMRATDYKPSRIEAAKHSAELLVRSLKPNDYAGVVIFESGATTAAYLSPFKDKVIEKIRAINAREGRTALGDGLALGIDMATSIPNKKRVVILLSDGVANAGVISPTEAIEYAKRQKVQVFTVGMGSEGKVVLGYDWFGNPQYAELDEATLKKIAEQTNGKYFKSVDEHTLEEIYRNISKNIKRERELTNIKDYFFFTALGVLLVELYLRFGRRRVIP